MLEEIKQELGENFRDSSDTILNNLLTEITANALSISNRENTNDNVNLLKHEIKTCVKGIYLKFGAEGLNSLSQGNVSSNFKDNIEEMRNNIIKSGKRKCY